MTFRERDLTPGSLFWNKYKWLFRIYYDCDADKGDSGAPVTNSANKVIGIHIGGLGASNRGVRVTQELVSTVYSFK